MAYSICCEFKAINNEAEYEALIVVLEAVKEMNIKHVHVNCDSLLIVNQVNGLYEAKDAKMITYLSIVGNMHGCFKRFTIQQIAREANTEADALAGLGAVFKNVNLTSIPIIHVMKPTSQRKNEMTLIMSTGNNEDVQGNNMTN